MENSRVCAPVHGVRENSPRSTLTHHAVLDRVTSTGHCERHSGRCGVVSAVDGPEWTRVSFSDGSYCEGSAVDFLPETVLAHVADVVNETPAEHAAPAERLS